VNASAERLDAACGALPVRGASPRPPGTVVSGVDGPQLVTQPVWPPPPCDRVSKVVLVVEVEVEVDVDVLVVLVVVVVVVGGGEMQSSQNTLYLLSEACDWTPSTSTLTFMW